MSRLPEPQRLIRSTRIQRTTEPSYILRLTDEVIVKQGSANIPSATGALATVEDPNPDLDRLIGTAYIMSNYNIPGLAGTPAYDAIYAKVTEVNKKCD